jgi:phosphate transport system substrate-binding protein
MLAASVATVQAGPVSADNYVPVSGAGSTWSQNALTQWIADESQYGITVNYAGVGSTQGREEYLAGAVDFAASDIPFQTKPTDGSAPENPAPNSFAYIPVTAGGTAFMYHLKINGQQVTNLRLSGQNVAKIFTGVITKWNDPAIAADNPQLTMPDETITPVVRSDGSGSTAQFSLWLLTQYPNLWNAYCSAAGRSGECGETSLWPAISGQIAQNGDLGVAGYVSAAYAEGTIGYVNYSYALNAKYPVVKVLNPAGYYTEPTPYNVAVSLLKAQVDTTDVNDPSLYLTQQLNGVYNDTDPRTYVLSSYSYMILPTVVKGQFSTAKGKTLAAFSYYAMCQGQSESADLGYSPMPFNLVLDTFTQIAKIPGQAIPSAQLTTVAGCHNPTINPNNPSDPNLLATQAPQPQGCDKQGPTQCATPTGGAKTVTRLSGGGGGSGSSSSGGSSGSGGTSGSGGSRGGATATGAAGTAAAAAAGRSGARGRGATGTATGGQSGSAGGAASGATGQNAAACDPSSGTCGGAGSASADSSGGGGGGGGDSAGPSATSTTLAAARGWTSTQTLMALIGLLLLGLVFAPSLASRVIRRRE